MKKTVLLYNCFLKLPIRVLHILISKADLVFFHLPSLIKTKYTDIEKKAGQLWIGWKYEPDDWLIEDVESIWEHSFDFYLSFFPYNQSSTLMCRISPNQSDLLFEASTWYCFWPEVASRLHQYNPQLKFIFLLRDPVKRAVSQYNMLIGWTKQQNRNLA